MRRRLWAWNLGWCVGRLFAGRRVEATRRDFLNGFRSGRFPDARPWGHPSAYLG